MQTTHTRFDIFLLFINTRLKNVIVIFYFSLMDFIYIYFFLRLFNINDTEERESLYIVYHLVSVLVRIFFAKLTPR